MTATAATPERRSPRMMLASIALLDELPVPSSVQFLPDKGILSLRFDRLVDGRAWSMFLDAPSHTFVHDGVAYLDHESIAWLGWFVLLHAYEPATPDPDAPVDESTRVHLAALAGVA